MSRPADLVRALVLVAADLDERGYAGAGIVRWAARELADGARPGAAAGDSGCQGCGADLVQPPRGRKRKWCSEECRRAA